MEILDKSAPVSSTDFSISCKNDQPKYFLEWGFSRISRHFDINFLNEIFIFTALAFDTIFCNTTLWLST